MKRKELTPYQKVSFMLQKQLMDKFQKLHRDKVNNNQDVEVHNLNIQPNRLPVT